MRKGTGILLIALLILLTGQTQLEASGSGAAVLFLRIAAGARAAGMGEAFVAVADDATATHWNPAGLGTYPLSSRWFEVKIPQELLPLKKVAIFRNESPHQDYMRYDVWALTAKGLVRFSPEFASLADKGLANIGGAIFYKSGNNQWAIADIIETGADQTAESILRQYAGLAGETAETKVPVLLEKIGFYNNAYPLARIDSLKESVMNALAPDYKGRFEFDTAFTALHDAYNFCLVDWETMTRAFDIFRSSMKDSVINKTEADKLLFSIEKSRRRAFPERFVIPYELVFDGTPQDITSDENNLWVGTSAGLYRYNGRNWQKFGMAEGLPSENILMVKAIGTRVYIGTEFGLATYEKGAFTYYGEPTGLPPKPIIDVASVADDKVWALCDNDLYLFDGKMWRNYYEYNDVLGMTDSALYEGIKIYGTLAEKEKFLGKMAALNVAAPVKTELPDSAALVPPATDSTGMADTAKGAIVRVIPPDTTKKEGKPAVGRVLKIPFTAGFNARLTALETDVRGAIWIGTEYGLFRYMGRKWTRFGYREYKAEKDVLIFDLALERMRGDSARAQRLAENICAVNGLTGTKIHAGEAVQIYANPAGSQINQVKPMGGKVFFATDRGTIWYDGHWSRYNIEDLGSRYTLALDERGKDSWYITSDRIKVKAGARSELAVMHVNWLPELANDIYYEFMSYVRNVEGWGTVGGNLTFLSYGNITRTDEAGRNLGDFSAFDIAMTLSYGTALTPSLSGGISTKIIYSHLSSIGSGREKGSGTSTGLAFDIGLLYRLHRRVNLGVAVTNLGPDVSYIDVSQADPLPRNLAVGLAVKLVESNYNKLLATVEANKLLVNIDDGFKEELKEVILNGGMEYWYGSFIALRGGYIYDQDGEIKTPTFGFGLAYKMFQFDFAYIPSSDQVPLANTARLSLSIDI